jgi:sec-independent protein translocase protein TatA
LGTLSLSHWLIVLLVVVLLFGAGKIPRLMGDLAKGIKVFRSDLNEGDPAPAVPAKSGTEDGRTTA